MAEKTPINHYDYFFPDALIYEAQFEVEIRWRRKGATGRWDGFTGRVIGPEFSLDLFPGAEYDLKIRRRKIGEEEWGEWRHDSFRATSHAQARDYRQKMQGEEDQETDHGR